MKVTPRLDCKAQLALTPSLKQAISLLAMSYADLNDHIQQECTENPLLYIKKQYSRADHSICLDIADNYKPSMASYLEQSLLDTSFSPYIKNIFMGLIEQIDEHGFLALEHRKRLPAGLQKIYVKWVLQLEPTGLGAADLYENLIWQLEKKEISFAQQKLIEFLKKVRSLEKRLDEKSYFFHKFEKDRPSIQKEVDILFNSLQLYPSRSFEGDVVCYPQPELLLLRHATGYQVRLYEPHVIRVEIKKPQNHSQDCFYQQGMIFKKMLQTRYQTLLSVANYIVQRQRDFFDYGIDSLKPLQLTNIAEALSLHESTISRVVQSKYIWTENGFIALKDLFSRKLSHESYGSVSISHIQACLKSLIDSEDKRNPFSDQQIQIILERQGYQLARRTIAKYRESFGYANSRHRRQK